MIFVLSLVFFDILKGNVLDADTALKLHENAEYFVEGHGSWRNMHPATFSSTIIIRTNGTVERSVVVQW